MTTYLAEAPEVQRWFGNAFRTMFDTGSDTPIERTVQGLLWLVSGAADALSGRNIGDWDNIADLMRRADEIKNSDLYMLGRITNQA